MAALTSVSHRAILSQKPLRKGGEVQSESNTLRATRPEGEGERVSERPGCLAGPRVCDAPGEWEEKRLWDLVKVGTGNTRSGTCAVTGATGAWAGGPVGEAARKPGAQVSACRGHWAARWVRTERKEPLGKQKLRMWARAVWRGQDSLRCHSQTCLRRRKVARCK